MSDHFAFGVIKVFRRSCPRKRSAASIDDGLRASSSRFSMMPREFIFFFFFSRDRYFDRHSFTPSLRCAILSRVREILRRLSDINVHFLISNVPSVNFPISLTRSEMTRRDVRVRAAVTSRLPVPRNRGKKCAPARDHRVVYRLNRGGDRSTIRPRARRGSTECVTAHPGCRRFASCFIGAVRVRGERHVCTHAEAGMTSRARARDVFLVSIGTATDRATADRDRFPAIALLLPSCGSPSRVRFAVLPSVLGDRGMRTTNETSRPADFSGTLLWHSERARDRI